MKLEPAQALSMALALMLIYTLASVAAARSFAELVPAPFAVSGSSSGDMVQPAASERIVIPR